MEQCQHKFVQIQSEMVCDSCGLHLQEFLKQCNNSLDQNSIDSKINQKYISNAYTTAKIILTKVETRYKINSQLMTLTLKLFKDYIEHSKYKKLYLDTILQTNLGACFYYISKINHDIESTDTISLMFNVKVKPLIKAIKQVTDFLFNSEFNLESYSVIESPISTQTQSLVNDHWVDNMYKIIQQLHTNTEVDTIYLNLSIHILNFLNNTNLFTNTQPINVCCAVLCYLCIIKNNSKLYTDVYEYSKKSTFTLNPIITKIENFNKEIYEYLSDQCSDLLTRFLET